jgi:two-component system nitrate/nitrite response regulator NarL
MFESFGRVKPSSLSDEPSAVLTDRELEIFRCIGQGMASKAVAAQLGISVFTVDTHRRNIGAKLGLTGADLVQAASVHIRTSLA